MRKVTKIKIRYYSREILKYLLLAGAVYIAAYSPYFALNLTRNISRIKKDLTKQKASNTFNYLKKRGLIEIKREGHDVRVVLTKEGRKLAGKYQIDDLEIERPKKWDKKYRLLIFDIPNSTGFIRDILRRKLKEWGFYALQKSVWVHAFDCREEVELLREFLELNKRQLQVLEVTKLEDDRSLRKFFNI